MSDFQSAVGLAALDTYQETLRFRRDLAACYLSELDKQYDVSFQCSKEELQQHTFPFFPIKYEGDSQKLIDIFKTYDIGHRQYYRPLHLHPRYASKKRNKKKNFPVCNELAEKVFCLPCHNSMTLADVKMICSYIKEVSDGAR